MPVDSSEFRAALSRFVSGVTVVTTRAASRQPVGVTISAFCSLSLDPPLILFCLERSAQCFESFVTAEGFTVNVLAEGQAALSAKFAAPLGDRWRDVSFAVGQAGMPVLPECAANLECRRHAVHDGGDHAIVVGEVLHVQTTDRPPLVYFRGTYGAFDPMPRAGTGAAFRNGER